MSKLTREVKYLQESDRPKKAKRLKFTNWCKEKYKPTNLSAWSETEYDFAANQYATYLQEFNAGEKPIELEFFFSTLDGLEKNIHKIDDDDIIVYLGNCKYDGDVFSVNSQDGIIRFYSGKLNSGRY